MIQDSKKNSKKDSKECFLVIWMAVCGPFLIFHFTKIMITMADCAGESILLVPFGVTLMLALFRAFFLMTYDRWYRSF